MNLDLISQLVKTLKDAPELGSIEIRRGFLGLWASVRVSRAGHQPGGAAAVVVGQVAASPMASGAMAGPAAAAPAAAPAAAAPATNLVEVKSPMVGTFYKSPEPAAEAYVKVGSRVTTGQVVCIIEAMKIMNEIESEVQGVVREVCVENAQPVEFGQVLFRLDPNG
ncbi:MAG TPA: acetyl-CoA carboxylase biotin carboxyl carrier protein [Gemmatimonadales bacterium]|jgi:acetyl-CoA carboxylase biotin carboxyl carrier protein|nr:acetyl-CoA carboxylase biotin carboxyl carrier protein [Gemmatimonadales bacterium]